MERTSRAGFCVEALSEALARFGKPGIFNTDQGAQFTSDEFTKVLRDHGIAISMDGRGRCHDNICVAQASGSIRRTMGFQTARSALIPKRGLMPCRRPSVRELITCAQNITESPRERCSGSHR